MLKINANIDLADNLGRKPLDIASEMALRGYREIGEENPHAKIVLLLKAVPQKNHNQDLNSVTEAMSNLSLHATSKQSIKKGDQSPVVRPPLQNSKNEDGCRLF